MRTRICMVAHIGCDCRVLFFDHYGHTVFSERVMDKKKLTKALREAKATPIQVRMAAILLAVNGLENALEFIEKTKQ